jgi:hypothetical protein
MNPELELSFLETINETLTAIIVIVSVSILLYNLTRNLRARVARTSSVLLACVTGVYMVDVLTSLDPTLASLRAWLRVQWVGIAFAPAAMFHLSDALLATTGLVSRGRRRRTTRVLYGLSMVFLLLVLFTATVVYGLVMSPAPHLLPGPLFLVYAAYFLVAVIVSIYNVMRARQRCRTTYTHRRMGYLLYSFTLPAFGIFPYSLLFGGTQSSPLLFWSLVILSNLGIALMLIFISYPLSFFGSSIPDRVVKSELLNFFLRGPATGIWVLLVVLFLPRAGRVMGLQSEDFMPFAAVAVVMFWQWAVSVLLPPLERILVFQADQEQVKTIQSIGQRLLTSSDLDQLFEAILAANCDLLQVPVAFIATVEGEQVVIKQTVGNWTPGEGWDGSDLKRLFADGRANPDEIAIWDEFWVVPLYSVRMVNGVANGNGHNRLLGLLGVQARAESPNLSSDEQHVFEMLVHRAAQALDDRLLQMDVFASLEGLLPEMEAIQQLRDMTRYGDFPVFAALQSSGEDHADVGFANAVFDALRDYWGGPRLTQSPLLNLTVVRAAMPKNDGNPTKALRAVLQEAVSRLRPVGERSMTRSEWTLFNIVDLRFVQGYKVRDVATRLVMSEADLYRKQRVAVEQVARVLADMERSAKESQTP